MSTIEIEMGEPRHPRKCECCGATIESTHGFIYRDDWAFAVYQAAWCEGHPQDQVNARIEIGGDWGDSANRPKHEYFALRIFRAPRETGFSFLEPKESMWMNNEKASEFLTRGAALAHPLKSEILHIAEHVANDDTRIKAFLDRHEIDA
jgi:hypothetical protein